MTKPITDAEAHTIMSNLPSEPTKHYETLLERLLADRKVAMEILEGLLAAMKINQKQTAVGWGVARAVIRKKARALLAAVKGGE